MSENPTVSLRDQLTAKQRRRMLFPVELSDATEARQAVDEARQKMLWTSATSKDEAEKNKTIQDLAQAEAALAEHYTQLRFVSARPSEYEALSATHFDNKDDKDIVVDDVLPALAAICAEDEELRDEAWWRQYLNPQTTTWSVGERGNLYGRLVELNIARPDVRIPKG